MWKKMNVHHPLPPSLKELRRTETLESTESGKIKLPTSVTSNDRREWVVEKNRSGLDGYAEPTLFGRERSYIRPEPDHRSPNPASGASTEGRYLPSSSAATASCRRRMSSKSFRKSVRAPMNSYFRSDSRTVS